MGVVRFAGVVLVVWAAVFSVSVPASATGSLVAGEIVVAEERESGGSILFRMKPTGTLLRGHVFTAPPGTSIGDFAIASPSSLFVLIETRFAYSRGASGDQVWLVDVRDESSSILIDLAEHGLEVSEGGNISVDSGGRLVVDRGATLQGHLGSFLLDRNTPNQWEPLPSGVRGVWGPGGRMYRLDGNTILSVDPQTGQETQLATSGLGVPVLATDPYRREVVTFGPIGEGIERFDANTGTLVDSFVPPSPDYITLAWRFTTDANGDLFVYPGNSLLVDDWSFIFRQHYDGPAEQLYQSSFATRLGYPPRVLVKSVRFVHAECSNGVDDDLDGDTDADDINCRDGGGAWNPDDNSEGTDCADGKDNDADGVADWNGIDLNGDGDFLDFGELSPDPKCQGNPHNESETPECGDGINNGDLDAYLGGQPIGYADKDDPHCVSAFDRSEVPECNDGLDNDGLNGPDDTFVCAFPEQLCEGILSSCPIELPACADGWDNDDDGFVDVDDPDCLGSPVNESEFAGCGDEIDNDGDGTMDFDPDGQFGVEADEDCLNGDPQGERPACNDGRDNNIDGLIDYPEDPGCTDIFDDTELAACEDGIDNDGDGFVDFIDADEDLQADPGSNSDPDCVSRLDHAEDQKLCSNGIDDDGDTLIDFDDPDCAHDADDSEVAECVDGIDNDNDGYLDLVDPNCSGGTDDSETPECSDGLDNDRDGFIDDADVHCKNPNDDGEAPECSDGRDNDDDDLVDFPADPDCQGPNDNREARTPVCATASFADTLPISLGAFLIWLVAFVVTRRRKAMARVATFFAVALTVSLGMPVGAQTSGGGQGQFTAVGSAPEANFFSGSMSMSVPIDIPPGRDNTTPSLALTYASGSGPGVFGYGWNLPLGSIESSTKTGQPRCAGPDTRNFVISMSGSSVELIYDRVDQTTGEEIYVPRVDEAFLEARAHRNDNQWTVHDRKGMTYRFGHNPSARVFRKHDEFYLWDEPVAECAFTSVWALEQIEDPNGNIVDFSYVKDEGTLYPDEIRYGANPLTAGLTEHPFMVKFLRTPRTYPVEQSHRGTRERMNEIIERIEVFYKTEKALSGGDPEAAWRFVRAYQLDHEDAAEYGRTIVRSIADDHTPGAGSIDSLLPVPTFTYAEQGMHYAASTPYAHPRSDLGYSFRDNGWTQTRRSLLDINGDGFSDLVESFGNGSHWNVYPGTVQGISATPFAWSWNGHFPGGGLVDHIQYQLDDGGDTGEHITRRWVVSGAVDLTGDGISDFVDARTTPWVVYPGRCSGSTSCGFGQGFNWDAPVPYLQDGTEHRVAQRLVDINGDGRVDLHFETTENDPPFVGRTQYVYLNIDGEFEHAPDMLGGYASASYTDDNHSFSSYEWIDFNGDGLLDFVDDGPTYCIPAAGEPRAVTVFEANCDPGEGQVGSIEVALNSGRSTGDNMTQHTFDEELVLFVPHDASAVRGSSPQPNSRTYVDFVDVNADGLPDRVYWMGHYTGWDPADNDTGLRVQLNLGGTGLEPLTHQPGGHFNMSLPKVLDGNLGVLNAQFIDIEFDNGGEGVETHTFTKTTVLDFNGDGYPDRVDSSTNPWTINYGTPNGAYAQPLALIRSENGYGGVTDVTYARSHIFDHTGDDAALDMPFSTWVLTGLSQTDGISPASSQTVTYADGLFDFDAREFRGYGTVVVRDIDGNEQRMTYGQGDFDRGKPLVSEQWAGLVGAGELLSRETSVYKTVPETPTSTDVRVQLYVAERKTEEFAVLPTIAAQDRCVLNRNEAPDAFGRISHMCSLPCAGAPATPGSCDQSSPVPGQIDTHTLWAVQISPVFYNQERAARVWTCYTNEDNFSEKLSEKKFEYDGLPFWGAVTRGNLTKVSTDKGPSKQACGTPMTQSVVVQNEYDSYGNIVKVTDPVGTVSDSTYDADLFSLYPVSECAHRTNPSSCLHEIEYDNDLRYGKPTEVIGANGEIGRTGYDALGRVICEAKPGQTLPRGTDTAGCDLNQPFNYAAQYQYYYGDPDASAFATPDPGARGKLSWVETRALNPGLEPLISRQYIDGLGRKRLSTTQRLIGAGARISTVVGEHVSYDASGRVVDAYAPYTATGKYAPGTEPMWQLVETPAQAKTTTAYDLNGSSYQDPLGRPYAVTTPDGRVVRTHYLGKRTRVIRAEGDETHENETRTTEDEFGRTILRESFSGSGATGTFETSNENTFDGMGRVLRERVAGNVTTDVVHTYDLLGREVRLDDPDSGAPGYVGEWEFAYDDNGNVVYRNDPKPNQHVQFVYDALGRTKEVCVFNNADESQVAITTDCAAAGGSRESAYTYDAYSDDHPGSDCEDADGGFPVGRLTCVEDQSGVSVTVYGQRGRVETVDRVVLGIKTHTSFEYDDTDRIIAVTYPDGERIRHIYKSTGELTKIVRAEGLNPFVTGIRYDIFGRSTQFVHGNGISDLREYYGADENYRLREVTSWRTGVVDPYFRLEYDYNALGKVSGITDHIYPNGALSNSANYTYDAVGRLTHVDFGATALPDEDYAFLPKGNIIAKGPNGGAPLSYGNGKPHQLTAYQGVSYFYDENGQRLRKEEGTNKEHYTYDALGRLTMIRFDDGDADPENDTTVDYVYDHSGQRAAKRVNEYGVEGAWTRFFSDAFESNVNEAGQGFLVKHYFAGDTRVATRRIQDNSFVDVAFVTPVPFTIPPWITVLLLCAVVVLLIGFGSDRTEVRMGLVLSPARSMGGALLVVVATMPLGLTGCAPPGPAEGEHYHFDHLGSTQMVTNVGGEIVHHVRYAPYGEVRGRFDEFGTPLSEGTDYQHEFTGYESDHESGLQYAGARYYDPVTAQFLSHDPERQYASPYAYGPGDPMNGTDPDGRLFGIDDAILAIGLIVAGALAAGIDAYIKTGSLRTALGAAGMSLASSAVGLAAGLVVGPVLQSSVQTVFSTSPANAALSLKIGMAGYGAYGVVQSAREGNYASALVGAAGVGLSAHGIAEDVGGASTTKVISGGFDLAAVGGTSPDSTYVGLSEDKMSWLVERQRLYAEAERLQFEEDLARRNLEMWEGTIIYEKMGNFRSTIGLSGGVTTSPGVTARARVEYRVGLQDGREATGISTSVSGGLRSNLGAGANVSVGARWDPSGTSLTRFGVSAGGASLDILFNDSGVYGFRLGAGGSTPGVTITESVSVGN